MDLFTTEDYSSSTTDYSSSTIDYSSSTIDYFSSTTDYISRIGDVFLSSTSSSIISQKNETNSMKAQLKLYDVMIPLLGTIIIITNFAVVVSSGLLLKKGTQPRCTYLFLGNVAMADLVTGVAVIFGQAFPKQNRDLSICSLQLGMIVSSTVVSIYSVGLIATDRFIYILHGLKYSRWVYPARARAVIAASWLLGLFVGFLPAMGFQGETDNGRVCWFIFWAPPQIVVFVAVIGVLPVLLVCALYSIILYHAVKKVIQLRRIGKRDGLGDDINDTSKMRIFRGGTKQLATVSENVKNTDQEAPSTAQDTEPEEEQSIKTKFLKKFQKKKHAANGQTPPAADKPSNPSKWKAIKVVLFTTGSFVCTWMPYFIACSISVFCDPKETPIKCAKLKYAIASPLAMLGFVNSLLNPLIYAWWHNGFRSSMEKLCCRKKRPVYQPHRRIVKTDTHQSNSSNQSSKQTVSAQTSSTIAN